MAITSWCYLLLLVFSLGDLANATVFTLQNLCSYTIWPGTLSGNGAATLGDGGFVLSPGSSIQLQAPPSWSGRFWARTGCKFDDSGAGKCVTGDCGGILKCTGGGAPPVTLAEFTIAANHNDKDFYDVSLVDGYNIGLGVKALGGSGDCQYAGVRRILMGTAQQNYRWLIRVRLSPARVLVKRLMHRSFVAPATIRHRSLAHRPSTRRCSRMHARRPTVMLMMMQQVLALAPGRIT
ncbi:hypothetical protein GH714_014959 [Hevea brasiliensis]|uniref:Thaumatin-like protein n=1 Tax=Hevea brasiliensis TaxID=3981 RepID=A0A6A6NH82_HEVBR|nr:hypothetical protein GH714_014959 [Hevea brasiliensis]